MTLTVWQVVLFLFLAATFGFVLCWFLKDYLLKNFKGNERKQAPVKAKDDSNTIDNLQEIRGISANSEDDLNKLGITSFAQVAQLDSSNMFKGLKKHKGNAIRYKWAEQAKVLHKEKYGEQKQVPVKGKVNSKTIDNLQEIKGISATAENALNNSGITSFAQVVKFENGSTIKGLERFKGNAKRYNWAEQAKALHRKKYGKDLR